MFGTHRGLTRQEAARVWEFATGALLTSIGAGTPIEAAEEVAAHAGKQAVKHPDKLVPDADFEDREERSPSSDVSCRPRTRRKGRKGHKGRSSSGDAHAPRAKKGGRKSKAKAKAKAEAPSEAAPADGDEADVANASDAGADASGDNHNRKRTLAR